jgi:hypothetical protein
MVFFIVIIFFKNIIKKYKKMLIFNSVKSICKARFKSLGLTATSDPRVIYIILIVIPIVTFII